LLEPFLHGRRAVNARGDREPDGHGSGVLATTMGASTQVRHPGGTGAASDHLPPEGAVSAGRTGQAVLIVDDDEELREAMVELFRDLGFDVEAVANGQLALDRLRTMSRAPALILLDLRMPIMDGIAFRAEQRRQAELCSIPVVLVTADCDGEKHARELGVECCLRKPVRADELTDLVQRYCGRGHGAR
jgi:CheY-like chemotaxis protein